MSKKAFEKFLVLAGLAGLVVFMVEIFGGFQTIWFLGTMVFVSLISWLLNESPDGE